MSTKKEKPKHLGRGLQSLIGPIMSLKPDNKNTSTTVSNLSNFPVDKDLQNSMQNIDISQIKPNPYQPRTSWDMTGLEEMAESIRTNGVIQPIVVRKAGKQFEVIAGERRLRAAGLAELKTIPAIVREAKDEELLELALVENIHRSDLNPIERAKAYQNFIKSLNITQQEAAHRLGKDRSDIANHLRLLDLPDEIKQMINDGSLSMGHARAILALPTDEIRRKLANRAMAGRLSVREVERLVRKHLTDSEKPRRPLPVKPAHIIDLENRLTSQLGTKVTIETRKNGNRGKVIIDFYSLDDFERITETIGLSEKEPV